MSIAKYPLENQKSPEKTPNTTVRHPAEKNKFSRCVLRREQHPRPCLFLGVLISSGDSAGLHATKLKCSLAFRIDFLNSVF